MYVRMPIWMAYVANTKSASQGRRKNLPKMSKFSTSRVSTNNNSSNTAKQQAAESAPTDKEGMI